MGTGQGDTELSQIFMPIFVFRTKKYVEYSDRVEGGMLGPAR